MLLPEMGFEHTESTTRSLISGWYDVWIEFMPYMHIFQHGAKQTAKLALEVGFETTPDALESIGVPWSLV